MVPVIVLGAWQTGISYDEPYHAIRLQNYLSHGWYLLDDDFDGRMPGEWVTDKAVYAPFPALVLHAFVVLSGVGVPGEVSVTAEAYAVRHLGVVAFAAVGTLAVAATVRLLSGSWRWGVVTAAVLVSLPMWAGHAMMNIKDVPVATGYSLVTLACVQLICRRSAGLGTRVGTVTLLGLGVVAAVGTRPGVWPGIAAACGLVALYLLTPTGRGHLRATAVDLVGGIALGGIALALLYPNLFLDWRWAYDAVFSSADYSGQTMSRLKVPATVVVDTPTVLLVIGVLGWFLLLFREKDPERTRSPQARWALVVVVAQALLLPSLVVIRATQMHGLRQLLFALPAMAVLLVLGIDQVIRRSAEVPRLKPLAVWVTVLAIVVPVFSQVRLFPYSYAYASAAVDSIPRLGTDYWRTSVRELEPSIPVGRYIVCTPLVTPAGDYLRLTPVAGRNPFEASNDCRVEPISPLLPYRNGRVDPLEPVHDTFLAVVTLATPPGKNCALLDAVTRPRHLADRQMSAVYECELVLLDHPDGGVVFSSDGSGSPYLLGGWSGRADVSGAQLSGLRGDLGFGWPEDGRPRGDFSLHLDVDTDGPVDVAVNNHSIATLASGEGARVIHVEGLPGSSLDEEGVVVTLRPTRDGGDVLLRHVRVETETGGE